MHQLNAKKRRTKFIKQITEKLKNIPNQNKVGGFFDGEKCKQHTIYRLCDQSTSPAG